MRYLIGIILLAGTLGACSAASSNSTTGSTSADGGSTNGAEPTVCQLAKVAWHDANSLTASVEETQASRAAVIGAAGGTENIMNTKSAAVLDAMRALTDDTTDELATTHDIKNLADACKMAGE